MRGTLHPRRRQAPVYASTGRPSDAKSAHATTGSAAFELATDRRACVPKYRPTWVALCIAFSPRHTSTTPSPSTPNHSSLPTFDSSWKALAWIHPGPPRRAPSPSPSFGSISERACGFAPRCASLSGTQSSSTPCRVAPAPAGIVGVRRESIARYSEKAIGGYAVIRNIKQWLKEGDGTCGRV